VAARQIPRQGHRLEDFPETIANALSKKLEGPNPAAAMNVERIWDK